MSSERGGEVSQDLLEFSGVVSEVEQKSEKAPLRFKLNFDKDNGYKGAKVFQVWSHDYETQAPNPAYNIIKASEGKQITVKYFTKDETYNGKTFRKNTVLEVEVASHGAEQQGEVGPTAPSASSLLDALRGWHEDGQKIISQLIREDVQAGAEVKW